MVFEPQYAHGIKEEVHKAAAIVRSKTLSHVKAIKKPISYLYNCYECTSSLCGSKEATSSCIEEWKNDRLAGRLKTDAKCGHGFRKHECNNWDISHFYSKRASHRRC